MSRQPIKRNVGTLLLAATLAVSLSGYVSGQPWRRLSGQGGTIAEAAKRLRQLQDSQQSRTEDADGQNQVRTGQPNTDTVRRAMDAYRRTQGQPARVVPGQLNTDAVRRAMDAYRRTQGQPARVVPGQLNTDAVRRAMDAYRRTQGNPARIIPGQLNADAIRGAMEAREQNEGGRFGLVPGQINAEAVRRAIEAHAEASRRAEEDSAEDPGSVDWPETEDPADWPEADEPADWPLDDGPQRGVSDVQEGIGLVRDIIDVIRDFRNATGPRSDGGFDGGYDGGAYDESEYDDTYNDDVYDDSPYDETYAEDEYDSADFDAADHEDEVLEGDEIVEGGLDDAQTDVPQNDLPPATKSQVEKLVILLNPEANGAAVSCLLGGEQLTLEVGDFVDRTTDQPLIVKFHRGGEFGTLEYQLIEGVYEFEAGSECWDLRRRTFKVTIDNTENTEDFQFTINGESTAVLAGESQEHEARFPIDLGYDQGDGEEQLLSDQISGGYQVQIDPETQVVTLAAVAPPAR